MSKAQRATFNPGVLNPDPLHVLSGEASRHIADRYRQQLLRRSRLEQFAESFFEPTTEKRAAAEDGARAPIDRVVSAARSCPA